MLIGDLRADAVSDGTFVARPEYFGPDLAAGARPDFFSRHGAAWLPIGCFVIRAGDRLVLVDAGLGPDRQELPHDMHLVGGQLLTGLRALGVTPVDITDVICTHLHADHVGWLFGLDAQPVFGRAAIWAGEADWRHFVTGPGEMLPHIRTGWRAAADTGRFRPLTVTPRSPRVSPLCSRRGIPPATCASCSPPGRNGPCSSAMPSPARSSSTSQPGIRWATSIPPWRAGPGSACGASLKTTARQRRRAFPRAPSLAGAARSGPALVFPRARIFTVSVEVLVMLPDMDTAGWLLRRWGAPRCRRKDGRPGPGGSCRAGDHR